MPDTIRVSSATPISVSIAAIADQMTLTAVTLDSTVTDGTAPYTYAWTVDGATTGIVDETAASTTYTPTAAGKHTAVCTITDAAGATRTAAVSWTVGDADGRVRTHAVDWTDTAVAGSKTNNGTETLDGIELHYGVDAGGSPTYVAGPTGLVATPAGSPAMSLRWTATDLGDVTMATRDDVVWYVALDASITSSGSDYTTLTLLDSTGNDRVVGQLTYSGGSHVIRAQRRLSGTFTTFERTLPSQARQIALRFTEGLLAEVRYSLSAFDGTFAAFSSMTAVYSTNTTNCFTAYNPAPASGDVAPKPALSGALMRITTQGSARTYARTEIRRRAYPGA